MSSLRGAAFWFLAAAVYAQTTPPASLSLVMERSDHDRWKAVNPQTVLDNGDSIRFKLTPNFSGYLYAYYQGSGGEAEWLYPAASTATDNRIEGGGTYLIPSGNAFYTITGKPGFDVVYWLVSPTRLSDSTWQPPAAEKPVPRTMLPRCRDDLSPAHACLDNRAGAAASGKIPLAIPQASDGQGTLKARELRLNTTGDTTRVESVEGPGLFVYEFRIAHR